MEHPGGAQAKRGNRVERFLFGEAPSALEELWGHELYVEKAIVSILRYWVAFLPATVVALVLADDTIPGFQTGHAAGLLVFSAIAVGGASRLLRSATQLTLYRFVLTMTPLGAAAVWILGPSFAEAAALMPVFATAFALVYTRRAAISLVALIYLWYGIVLFSTDGFVGAAARFVFVAGIGGGSLLLMQFIVGQIRVLAESERAAHAALADVNAELEERVTEQVDEIDRLGRLRRFLSPQVADTVMSTGGEEMLSTHRRNIAVVFVDLRGFTSFSGVAEPEDVVDVLTEFYAAVGKIVKRLEATVGGFQGDGVMAYFNDPFPCDDPAGRALEMATSFRDPLDLQRARWAARGFDIGFGVGIAYGYATLGTIGFEERSDYTPIGSVVNLASRLCDEARHGEVLLDARAYEAVQDRVEAVRTNLELKGFSGVVTAYRVTLQG